MEAVRSAAGKSVAADLAEIARTCRAEHVPAPRVPADFAELAQLEVTVDDDYCRAVADRHESAPLLAYDEVLARRYDQTKLEVRNLYEATVASGFVVQPWPGSGPPYSDSRDLARRVRATRTIHVLLTRDAHGPFTPDGFHPLREPSGIVAGGVELLYNDLVRTVHDLFGHVLFAIGFGPVGELRAAYCHMALHSDDAASVLLTEQVAQICWFFFGRHVRDRAGRIYGPGDREYVAWQGRPYPAQKVYASEPDDLASFRRMFQFTEVE
jgi:hypothetical protein